MLTNPSDLSDFSHLKIVLISVDDKLFEQLRRILKKEHMTTSWMLSVDQALRLKPQPQLAFIDDSGLDGASLEDVTQRMGKQFPDVRIVYVVPSNHRTVGKNLQSSGVADYVVKPLDGIEIMQTIQQVADKQRGMQTEVLHAQAEQEQALHAKEQREQEQQLEQEQRNRVLCEQEQREQVKHDAGVWEQAKREEELREQALREQVQRERELREQALHEQVQREQELREQALREQVQREKELRDQALREQVQREQAQRKQELLERVQREQAQREQELRAQVQREQELREQALREQLQREQLQREQELREQLQREQALREQALLEQEQREQAQRERELFEQEQYEQAQREQELLEQAQREQAQREQELLEQEQREQAQREQELLAQEQREHELRERARKEQAQREQELREQAHKEQEQRERELRERVRREQEQREQELREQDHREQAQRERAASVQTPARQAPESVQQKPELRKPQTPAKVITLFSTIAGTGKTTLAVNLAAALAKGTDARVCIVDADLQFGDVARYLHHQASYTIADYAENFCKGRPVTDYLCRWNDQLHFLAVPELIKRSTDISSLILSEAVKELEQHYKYIIIDTCTGFTESTINMLDLSNNIVFVNTVEHIPSIKKLRVGLEVLKSLGHLPKVHLLLNRDNSQKMLDLRQVSETTGISFQTKIVNDYETVVRFIKTGIPFVRELPGKLVSKQVCQLAEAFVQPIVTDSDKELEKQSGLLKKLADWF